MSRERKSITEQIDFREGEDPAKMAQTWIEEISRRTKAQILEEKTGEVQKQ